MRRFMGDIGLLLIRLMIAVVMIFHGSQKLFGAFDGNGMPAFIDFVEGLKIPSPQIAAYLAAGTEFFGGILVGIGLLTRIVAIPICFNMLVAVFVVHGHTFSNQEKGFEYPLTLAVIAAALFFTGPGRLSLDFIFTAEKKEEKKK